MVRRVDVVALDGATKTPEGYLDTAGNLSRTGVQSYRREDGTEQLELRLPEHVFRPDSIASVDGQPVALKHPPENFNAENFRTRVAGIVIKPEKAQDGQHLRARVRIMDAEAVRAVEGGMRELSCGYDTDLVPVPGGMFRRDDWNDGKEVRADYLQTNIRINHVAIVDRGRAGPTARLDSAGDQQERTMDPKELQAKIDAAVKDALKPHLDELEKTRGEKTALEAELKRANDERQTRLVGELAGRVAAAIKRDAKELEQLGEEGILRAALEKLSPEVKTDGWQLGSLRGAFEVAMRQEAKRTDSATLAANAVAGAKRDAIVTEDAADRAENASEQAYQKMRTGFANAWKNAGQKA